MKIDLMIGVAVAAALSAASANAATAVGGFVSQHADAQVTNGAMAVDENRQSFSGTPTALGFTVDAPAQPGEGNAATADTHSTIAADWVVKNGQANSGTVDITNHGWTVSDGGGTDRIDATTRLSTEWSYTFDATSDGEFILNSEFHAGGNDFFGLGKWTLSFAEDGAAATTESLLDRFTSPDPLPLENMFSLEKGHRYVVSVSNFEDVGFGGLDPTGFVGEETAKFGWTITGDAGAVPEPASWALMIGGFGMAGAVLRRRRQTPVAA